MVVHCYRQVTPNGVIGSQIEVQGEAETTNL
ncbi:MAG: hypothetical protein BWX68_01258 [Verrucomicrobia bacterium ADurb.Bin063]|nr:MAG: hypothetical protein BWX68_01258 [Verrucomicrobia bacterium ADurb.Bin063]